MEHFRFGFTKERWVLLHKDLSCAILFTWDCLLTSSFNESQYFYYHAVHSIGFNTLLHLIINKVQRYPPLSHTDLPAKHSFETSSYLKLFFTVWINTVLAVDAFVLLQWRPSPRRLLLLLTFLMSKQPSLGHTPTDILWLCPSSSKWKSPPFPGFPVATERSPSLYFLIPQVPCQSPFPCPWSGWVWCQAYFQGSADGRNAASAPPRCEAHAMNYIMKIFLFSGAIFYYFSLEEIPWSCLQHSPAKSWNWENWGVAQHGHEDK